MAKLTLTSITSGYGGTTLYNANNVLIEAALENTLSRDGTTPNTMSAPLDMNSQYIINVPSPNSALHVVNKAYVDNLLTGTTDAGSAALRVDLASTANTKGASLVGVEDTAGNFAGANVETVLAEIISDYALTTTGNGASKIGVFDTASNFAGANVEAVLAEIIADYALTTNGNGASKIGIEDSAGGLVATTVEAALAELTPVGLTHAVGFATGAGTADAITANFTPDITLTDGMCVLVKAVGAITSTSPTFAPDGLSATIIVKENGGVLSLSDITGANQSLFMQYDSTLSRWLLLNPNDSSSSVTVSNYVSGRIHVEDDVGSDVTGVDITSVGAEDAWESYGPTGSGADNIWTGLNSIPSNAVAVIIRVLSVLNGSTNGDTYSGAVYGRVTGSSTGKHIRNLLVAAEMINRSGSVERTRGDNAFLVIPIDSSKRFDLYWEATGTSPTYAADAYQVGFVI